MSKIGVSLKINVKEIEKARLFQGNKGTYLDATVFIDINNQDQYGNNGMITQDVSKEERDSGTRGNILGNCKVFYNDAGNANHQPNGGALVDNRPQLAQQTPDEFLDEIPF
tara:strand:+ start:15381 stop:15713 length:333 start_codon:yes stop_codon:yes gene_type:complete